MSKISQQAREKISKKLTGIKRSDETKKKMSQAKRTFISEEVKQDLIYNYTINKKTLSECGAKHNLDKSQVKRVLKENNIHIRTNSEAHTKDLDNKTVKSVINDYNSGLTIGQCSVKYNISNHQVYTIVKKYCKIRHQKEYLTNRKRPQEVKDKISKKNKGHRVNQEVVNKLQEYNKNMTKEQLKMRASKAFLTKKKNNSFNKSKPEEDLYNYLLKENVNKTIFRQYKDKKRYPYYCDFYILEDDLFIELNAHWTHGGRPFDSNDIECLKKLDKWKEKAKTSKFYQTAIEVWTVRDVEKQKVAKENKLNYKVIY